MTVLVMGVTGCGKTTVGQLLARELGWNFADADDWHPESNRAKMQAGIPLDDSDRGPWLEALAALVTKHESVGDSLVLACSALKQAYRERLGFVESAAPAGRRIVFLRVAALLSASRLASRPGHFMNPLLVASQFATLEEPGGPGVLSLEASDPLPTVLREIKSWLALDGGTLPVRR